MRLYRLTPAAQHDLSSIWGYTEERCDILQAETYVRDIQSAIERIADDPRRGRPCDGAREGYRQYSVGSHLLFYVESATGVDVIRILHLRMDPDRHL